MYKRKEKGEVVLKPLRLARRFPVVFIVVLLVVSPFLLSVQAPEPSLEEVLNYLGFPNRALSSAETFSAGSYEITLYAEFAGYSDQNELSYYNVANASELTLIFTGPDGGSGYIDPPVTKSFTADYEFGLSMLSPGPKRYYTETFRNGDGLQHAKVYENLDDPGMFLIGFENLWGGGDKDYNDMVFSLKPLEQPPVALFDYSPLYPVVNETITFNASDSYDPDGSIVSYQWDFGDGNITTVNDPIITHIYTAGNSTINCTVTLTVTDNDGLTNSTTATVPVTNPAILHVSLPAGEDRTGISDPDPWLSECWLLNITGASGTFTVKIEDVSRCISSYDTHLVIALNDAAYNNLLSLTVDSTVIVKNDFKYGTLRPYDLWNWPSGDVYPTWFNGTLVNVGTIPPEGHTNVTVSVTFSDATGARMHFDAYGSKESCPIPPKKTGYITHNPLSGDSTVLFSPPPAVQYYLTVISPYGAPGGEGWYANCTNAYATLNTGIVDYGNGTRRVFTHWSGDASGTNYAQSDPIHIDQNKTAIANWKTQCNLTLITDPSGVTTPIVQGWYDSGTYASISTDEFVDITAGASRYRFDGWTTADMAEITNPASPSTTVLMDKPKTVTADYVIQYNVTFSQSGVGTDFTGTVVTIDSTGYGVGDLSTSFWWDSGTDHSFSFASPLLVDSDKQYVWTSTSGLSTLQSDTLTITTSGIVTGNYNKTQYLLTVHTNGLGTQVTNVYNDTDVLGTATDATPYTGWFDEGSSLQLNIDSPITDGSARSEFTSWSGDATGSGRPVSVTMSSAKDITANYKTQYKITFDQTGVSSDFTGTVVTIDGTDYNVGALSVWFWWDEGSIHSFDFKSPLVVTPNAKRYVWTSTSGLSSSQSGSITVSTSGSVIGNYKTQFYLTVTSPYDTPTPTSGWFDAGTPITASVTSPWAGPTDVRYVCTGWTGTGSVPASGSAATVTFTINAPSGITWTWKTQYYLTVKTDPTGLSPAPTPPSGWYDESTDVVVTAKSVSGYTFNYWDVDGVSKGPGVNPITVHMDDPHKATAHYQRVGPPPAVGGYAVPIDRSHLLAPTMGFAPWMGLALTFLAAMAVMTILIRRRNKIL